MELGRVKNTRTKINIEYRNSLIFKMVNKIISPKMVPKLIKNFTQLNSYLKPIFRNTYRSFPTKPKLSKRIKQNTISNLELLYFNLSMIMQKYQFRFLRSNQIEKNKKRNTRIPI